VQNRVESRSDGAPTPGFSALRGDARTPGHRLLDLGIRVGARLAVAGMAVLYAGLKLLPTRDKIVLMSRLYSRTSQDFALVRAEVTRQSPATHVVVLNHRNTNPRAVPLQMLTEMYHLATSRACITDSYMAAISVLRHKDALIVVQMWHALGAIKRFGLAAVGSAEGRPSGLARVMRMHRGYDWVIAGGKRMVEPFAQSFGVPPDRVLPIGTPRVDLLLDPTYVQAKRDGIRTAHPELGTRPLVLYAPTFRTAEPVHVEEMLAALAGADLDVVIALHPLDHRDFSARPGVTQDGAFSTLDWLTVADQLITDYSAVVFDAAVLGVPTYSYAYDLDDYVERRGLVLDYEHDMPGPPFRDAGELVAALLAGRVTPDDVARFRDEFIASTDGGCTRRIVQLALGAPPAALG
jgi:CDP-glycerol glycerophosphotransferase (TagB/SpsB family)